LLSTWGERVNFLLSSTPTAHPQFCIWPLAAQNVVHETRHSTGIFSTFRLEMPAPIALYGLVTLMPIRFGNTSPLLHIGEIRDS
jgi:hypothetical protein